MRDRSSTAPAVELLELTRRFGDLVAVDGLAFTVGRGELFGIVGPDGAGKTTTLRMLAGVLRPSEGDARLGGVSVARDPEGVKHAIAYMSQRFGLYEDLTVRENIDFYADLYRVPRSERSARRARLWEFSGLGPFESRLAGDLSGGMKQKLGLCCALVHQPDVLLLDEPTFGVDPISRRDLWLIVHEMVAAGTTTIVTTAYMDEAERCDRVALLHRGRLVGLDAPARLQDRLRGSILDVVADRPRAAVDALRQTAGVRGAALFGDRIHVSVDGGEEAWPEIRAALEERGVRIGKMRVIDPSLEDVFIELVGAGEDG